MDEHETEAPVMRAIEDWAKDKGTEAHFFAGAKYQERWGLGREVTEHEFDEAIQRVMNITLQ